jgi:hypothetical protein
MSDSVEVLRLYDGEHGESRFETVDIPMELRDFAPPADPLYVSDPEAATRYVLIQLPPAGAASATRRRAARSCSACRAPWR